MIIVASWNNIRLNCRPYEPTLCGATYKARANARNIVGQQDSTLLSPICCERLHTMLCVVACCCDLLEVVGWSLKLVKLQRQQGPTFLLFRGHRSVVQQCWARLHSTSNKVAPVQAHYMPRIHTNTCEQEINMASEMENVNEELIKESTATKDRKKATRDGKDRGRARIWTELEIDHLIDLLEEKDCSWDVNKKDYHVRNKRERAFEEMDIDVAEIKAKITSLRAQGPLYSHLKTQHVVTCCERLHTSANIAQQGTTLLTPTMLPVVASVCTGLYY